MAEKAKKPKNQGLIISLCCAIVAIIVIAVVLVFVISNKNNGITGLNDSFFTSDGSKYVLTIDGDEAYIEEDLPMPTKYHLVYFYSGDNITGLKTYYQFADNEAAQLVYDYYIENNSGVYDAINIDNNYVIMTVPSSDYDGLTASDIKQQVDFIKEMEQIEPDENPDNYIEVDSAEETLVE